jgi:hypothetical protein
VYGRRSARRTIHTVQEAYAPGTATQASAPPARYRVRTAVGSVPRHVNAVRRA